MPPTASFEPRTLDPGVYLAIPPTVARALAPDAFNNGRSIAEEALARLAVTITPPAEGPINPDIAVTPGVMAEIPSLPHSRVAEFDRQTHAERLAKASIPELLALRAEYARVFANPQGLTDDDVDLTNKCELRIAKSLSEARPASWHEAFDLQTAMLRLIEDEYLEDSEYAAHYWRALLNANLGVLRFATLPAPTAAGVDAALLAACERFPAEMAAMRADENGKCDASDHVWNRFAATEAEILDTPVHTPAAFLAKMQVAKHLALNPQGGEDPEGCNAWKMAWSLMHDAAAMLTRPKAGTGEPCPVATLLPGLVAATDRYLAADRSFSGRKDEATKTRLGAALDVATDNVEAFWDLITTMRATSLEGAAAQIIMAGRTNSIIDDLEMTPEVSAKEHRKVERALFSALNVILDLHPSPIVEALREGNFSFAWDPFAPQQEKPHG